MATDRFEFEVPFDESGADVLVCMGSQSDWMSTMRHACDVLNELRIPFKVRILSAHRTPDRLHHAADAALENGFKVIVAGAGGAAHMPGMFAAKTIVPVIGVPVESKALKGMDSLLSIVQMPPSTPVGAMAIGTSGAKNAALYAASMLAMSDKEVAARLTGYRIALAQAVEEVPVDE